MGTGGATGIGGSAVTPAKLVSSVTSLPPYGSVAIGQSSGEASFSITNAGQQTSGSITLASSSAEFVVQTGLPGDCVSGTTALAGDATCVVRIVFSPQEAGARSGTIGFSAAPGGGGGVSVSGSGVTPPANLTSGSMTSINFGSVVVAQSSSEASFTITNTGQQMSGPITVTSNNSAFVIRTGLPGDCVSGGTTLAKDASCGVRMTFSPPLTGPRSGVASFSATPGGGAAVTLSGTGVCAAGDHDAGDGTCVAIGVCASGYHNDGAGNCVVNGGCPTDELTDGTGTCVPIAGATWIQRGRSNGCYWLASSANGVKLVAVGGNCLATSTDSGVTWTTSNEAHSWGAVASSSDGTKLVASETDGYLYTSTDSGVHWTQRTLYGPWAGVASSADGSKLVATCLSSGPTIVTSIDSGVHWLPRLDGSWGAVASSADGTKLVALNASSISTSVDSGETWTLQKAPVVESGWKAVASSSDGTKLFVISYDGNMYTSTDSGVNWTQRGGNPRSWAGVASSADGTKLIAAWSDLDGGSIFTSTDSGATWTQRATPQVWTSVASSSDGTKLVASANGGDIYTSSGPVP